MFRVPADYDVPPDFYRIVGVAVGWGCFAIDIFKTRPGHSTLVYYFDSPEWARNKTVEFLRAVNADPAYIALVLERGLTLRVTEKRGCGPSPIPKSDGYILLRAIPFKGVGA